MKFILPATHVLHFGIQAKKGQAGRVGTSQATNADVAEIHNQVLMCSISYSELLTRRK
jgi:hypothetical protein